MEKLCEEAKGKVTLDEKEKLIDFTKCSQSAERRK